jgi:hypothetical protein
MSSSFHRCEADEGADKMRVAAVLIAAISLAGCATITRGTKDAFSIQTTPPGAHAQLSSGQTCDTPCTLKLPRKSEFVVTLTKPGYKTVQASVSNHVAGGGAAGMAGNVLVGGLIGAAVDAGDGAMLNLVPNPLVVTLEPAEQQHVFVLP